MIVFLVSFNSEGQAYFDRASAMMAASTLPPDAIGDHRVGLQFVAMEKGGCKCAAPPGSTTILRR